MNVSGKREDGSEFSGKIEDSTCGNYECVDIWEKNSAGEDIHTEGYIENGVFKGTSYNLNTKTTIEHS